jgi:hypothetical protein
MMSHQCRGTNAAMGGIQGGMRRGRKATCPVCGRKIVMRPGRAGRLYAHKVPEALSGKSRDTNRRN